MCSINTSAIFGRCSGIIQRRLRTNKKQMRFALVQTHVQTKKVCNEKTLTLAFAQLDAAPIGRWITRVPVY
jgi:hypothetical protein